MPDSRHLLTLLRAKLRRRWDVQSLGPNEARFLYDVSVATVGVVITLAFSAAYLGGLNRTLILVGLPFLLLACNLAFGIYSRLRLASGRTKAFALLLGVATTAAITWALGGPSAQIVLWTLLTYPPLALTRLLLGLPYSRHQKLISVAVNHRGPVLVIGGAGYIGSHTVDLLLRRGYHVRVLDRLMYGGDSLRDFEGSAAFEFIEGDATNVAKLAQAMKGASAVVHLSGLVGDPACAVDPEFTRHANVIATRMAKEVAQSMGIQRFVFASSCSVYGASDREVSEADASNPVSLYAQTKIDSERELLAAARDNFSVSVLRFATVFGHSRRARFDLVGNLFTAQAMTDGLITVVGPDQWRPFIHVRDLARAIVAVIAADTALVQNQIFNVGDMRLNMTILDLAKKVQEVCGHYRSVEISISDNPQDRRNYAVSFDKIRSMLGFEAETLLEPGIQEMAEKFRDGQYLHYRSPEYSNVAMTAKAVDAFQDPAQLSHLYAPLYVGQ